MRSETAEARQVRAECQCECIAAMKAAEHKPEAIGRHLHRAVNNAEGLKLHTCTAQPRAKAITAGEGVELN